MPGCSDISIRVDPARCGLTFDIGGLSQEIVRFVLVALGAGFHLPLQLPFPDADSELSMPPGSSESSGGVVVAVD